MLPDSDRRTTPAFRPWLSAILLISLSVRLGWAVLQPSDEASLRALPDQVEYLTLARNLLSGTGLVFLDPRFGDSVYAYRMPAYPWLVAATGANALAIRIVQAFLDTSTVLAIALLSITLLRRPFGRQGALISSAIVGLNPFLIFFSGLVLSETLFTAMLAWGMLLLIVGLRAGRLRQMDDLDLPAPPARPTRGTLLWLAGGLILGASSLVRPSAIPLAVLLGTFAAFAARDPAQPAPAVRLRWPLPVATTMLLLTLAVLAPWAYRNSRVVGVWLWTTTNGGVTAYDGFNPDATGASDQTVLAALPQLKTMNEVERSAYLGERATRWARENLDKSLRLALAKAGRTWSPVPLSAEYGTWKHRLVGLLYSLPFDLLILLGIVGGPLSRSAKTFLLLPAVYFTLVHMASVGSLRYRVPVEPPMAVVAAAGLLALPTPRLSWRRAGSPDREGVTE